MYSDEKEVDLKKLAYRCVEHWRRIAFFSILIAVLASVVTGIDGSFKLNDEKVIEGRRQKYEGEVANIETEISNIEKQINKSKHDYNDISDYLAKSYIMGIDYMNTYNSGISMIVSTDYKIMPGSTYQNQDPADAIMQSYELYVSNGDFYRDVSQKMADKPEEKYLREVLSASVDKESRTITVSAIGKNAETVNALIDDAKSVFSLLKSKIDSEIYVHDVAMVTNSTYTRIANSIRDKQEEQNGRANELTRQTKLLLGEKLEKQIELNKLEAPDLSYADVAMTSLKVFLIAGFVSGILFVIYYCLRYILSSHVKGKESISKNIYLIAEMPQEEKKHGTKFDRWLSTVFGISIRTEDYKNIAAAAYSQIGFLAGENGNKAVSVVSDLDENELKKIIGDMESGNTASDIKSAGNILTNAAALSDVKSTGSAVLLVKCGESREEFVEKTRATLDAIGVKLLGAVVAGCDSV